MTIVCTRASIVERTAIRPWKRSSTPKRPAALPGQLVEDVVDRGGGVGLDRADGGDADRFALTALREFLRDVTVARHQGENLIAAVERPPVSGHGGVVTWRLADRSQQRCVARVIRRIARQGLAEVVLGRGREAVTAVAQVDEAGVAREDLALGLLLRSVPSAHLLLEPERQAHLLHLPEELVHGGGSQNRREEPGRGEAGVEERIPVGAARQVLQEVAADELLRERRTPLRQAAAATRDRPSTTRRGNAQPSSGPPAAGPGNPRRNG